jgi:hypothetical protein
MNKVYIAKGYNSWTNKELIRAFTNEAEADKFMENLTEPHITVMSYKSTVQLVNTLLGVQYV